MMMRNKPCHYNKNKVQYRIKLSTLNEDDETFYKRKANNSGLTVSEFPVCVLRGRWLFNME